MDSEAGYECCTLECYSCPICGRSVVLQPPAPGSTKFYVAHSLPVCKQFYRKLAEIDSGVSVNTKGGDA